MLLESKCPRFIRTHTTRKSLGLVVCRLRFLSLLCKISSSTWRHRVLLTALHYFRSWQHCQLESSVQFDDLDKSGLLSVTIFLVFLDQRPCLLFKRDISRDVISRSFFRPRTHTHPRRKTVSAWLSYVEANNVRVFGICAFFIFKKLFPSSELSTST